MLEDDFFFQHLQLKQMLYRILVFSRSAHFAIIAQTEFLVFEICKFIKLDFYVRIFASL